MKNININIKHCPICGGLLDFFHLDPVLGFQKVKGSCSCGFNLSQYRIVIVNKEKNLEKNWQRKSVPIAFCPNCGRRLPSKIFDPFFGWRVEEEKCGCGFNPHLFYMVKIEKESPVST